MGQIHYSRHFTKKLAATRVDFIEPVEGYYKVKMLKRDEFMRYDLVIHSEEREFEMRFCLQPGPNQPPPNITTLALASSLATNHQHFDLSIQVFPRDLAGKNFNAAWAAYVDFIPKPHLTDKHYARLVGIFDPTHGMIFELMLFNHHDEEKDRRLYMCKFQGGDDAQTSLPGR